MHEEENIKPNNVHRIGKSMRSDCFHGIKGEIETLDVHESEENWRTCLWNKGKTHGLVEPMN